MTTNTTAQVAFDRTSAAGYVGVTTDEIDRARRRGDLPARYLTSKPMFLRRDLDAWVESWPAEAPRRGS